MLAKKSCILFASERTGIPVCPASSWAFVNSLPSLSTIVSSTVILSFLFVILFSGIPNIILPTLGKERQKTYSPFLPICPDTGQVLEIPVKEINTKNLTLILFLYYQILFLI